MAATDAMQVPYIVEHVTVFFPFFPPPHLVYGCWLVSGKNARERQCVRMMTRKTFDKLKIY